MQAEQAVTRTRRSIINIRQAIGKFVADVVADMQASGETVFQPMAEKHYSVEFRVRIPPQPGIDSGGARVSLNRLASVKLAA